HYDPQRIIALTGRCVKEPQYYRLMTGYRLANLLSGRLDTSAPCRVIQGNVLTGMTSSTEDFLSAGVNHITVIPESGEAEFLGWAAPGFNKLSVSRSYPSFLFPNKEYDLNTTINGEHR